MKLNLLNNFFPIFALMCIFGYGLVFAAIELSDVVVDLSDITLGFSSELENLIPTAGELFDASEQVLFGLPEVAVASVINQLCSIYAVSGKIEPRVTPNIDEMYFQLRTPCTNSSIPVSQAENLLLLSEFDSNKKVVVFVTGWFSDINSSYIENMAKAFHCRGGYNFLALNTSDNIRTLYAWSALNTEEIGQFLAQGLEKLTQTIPVENIYLIGHSLGAHIVGAAGRYFTEATNQTLSRITGLDPANPCFNQGETLSGLYSGDAKFVDVIHTNPGVLGKKEPLGDVDFYAGGLGPIKPGCTVLGCSHSRAYMFYIESIYPENENNFLAKRCTSLTHLNNAFCDGPEYPMGYATPDFLKGDYFLGVNAEPPYGKNATIDAVIEPKECAQCESD